MALKLKGIKNKLFDTSKANDEGIGSRKLRSINLIIPGEAWNALTTAGVSGIAVAYTISVGLESQGTDFKAIYNLDLPNNSTITKMTVFGDDNADTWFLKKINRVTTQVTTMISSTFNTTITNITEPVIDKNKFYYIIETGTIVDGLHSAELDYTT